MLDGKRTRCVVRGVKQPIGNYNLVSLGGKERHDMGWTRSASDITEISVASQTSSLPASRNGGQHHQVRKQSRGCNPIHAQCVPNAIHIPEFIDRFHVNS
jgi:hypothetical protein